VIVKIDVVNFFIAAFFNKGPELNNTNH